jgi:hypothetical protein
MIGCRTTSRVIETQKRVRALQQVKYTGLKVRTKIIFKDIQRLMPTLTGNLAEALIYETDDRQMRVSIRLLAMGPYGTTDYFPCWPKTHKSIAQHTSDEISHAKAKGAMGIQANPQAVSGGKADSARDPFVRALQNEGFTDIRVIESGPKGKQRTYDATPPAGWPYDLGLGT